MDLPRRASPYQKCLAERVLYLPRTVGQLAYSLCQTLHPEQRDISIHLEVIKLRASTYNYINDLY